MKRKRRKKNPSKKMEDESDSLHRLDSKTKELRFRVNEAIGALPSEFMEDNPFNRDTLRISLEKLKGTSLKKIYSDFVTLVVSKNDSLPRKKVIKSLVETYFLGKTNFERKKDEKERLKSFLGTETLHFEFCGKTIPEELMINIFSFLDRNYSNLVNMGSACSAWYLFFLCTWHTLEVTKWNLFDVPLLAWKYARVVKFPQPCNYDRIGDKTGKEEIALLCKTEGFHFLPLISPNLIVEMTIRLDSSPLYMYKHHEHMKIRPFLATMKKLDLIFPNCLRLNFGMAFNNEYESGTLESKTLKKNTPAFELGHFFPHVRCLENADILFYKSHNVSIKKLSKLVALRIGRLRRFHFSVEFLPSNFFENCEEIGILIDVIGGGEYSDVQGRSELLSFLDEKCAIMKNLNRLEVKYSHASYYTLFDGPDGLDELIPVSYDFLSSLVCLERLHFESYNYDGIKPSFKKLPNLRHLSCDMRLIKILLKDIKANHWKSLEKVEIKNEDGMCGGPQRRSKDFCSVLCTLLSAKSIRFFRMGCWEDIVIWRECRIQGEIKFRKGKFEKYLELSVLWWKNGVNSVTASSKSHQYEYEKLIPFVPGVPQHFILRPFFGNEKDKREMDLTKFVDRINVRFSHSLADEYEKYFNENVLNSYELKDSRSNDVESIKLLHGGQAGVRGISYFLSIPMFFFSLRKRGNTE